MTKPKHDPLIAASRASAIENMRRFAEVEGLHGDAKTYAFAMDIAAIVAHLRNERESQ